MRQTNRHRAWTIVAIVMVFRRDRPTDNSHEVVNIDLCHYLSLARNAYESQNYGI